VAKAKEHDAALRGRLADQQNRRYACRVALVIGDDARVASIAEDLRHHGDHHVDYELAIVRSADGRLDEATSLLVSYIESFTSLDSVAAWTSEERPLLDQFLNDRNASAPDLLPAERELESLRLRLAARLDPLAELTAAPGVGGDPKIVASVKRCAALAVGLVRGDADEVEALLLASPPEADDLPSEPLQAWIDKRRQQGMAVAAIDAATTGRTAEARDLLSLLLDQAPWTTDEVLRDASPDGVSPEILGVLRSMEDDPELGSEAALVVSWLGGGETATEEPAPLSLELPPSWFEEVDDPVSQHALFLWSLPELRINAETTIPPVSVSTDVALEPTGYRIAVAGVVTEEGNVLAGRRQVDSAALNLLTPDISDAATTVDDPLLQPFGNAAIREEDAPSTSLAALLSLSVAEVVLRRLEAVVAAHPQELASADGSAGPTSADE
jgi:hypothetical protein